MLASLVGNEEEATITLNRIRTEGRRSSTDLRKKFSQALATAVWSVLKAKRRMLTYPNGFMAHFYDISEQMSPLMAWGFLGPDDRLREICQYFKDQVMGYLVDIFSFQRSRYTTVEELAEDIVKHTKERVDNLCLKLCKTIEEE